MCIIVYKPKNVGFPTKETLQHCFENNPDGAGFMFTHKHRVVIQKGFDTFTKFYKALSKVRKMTGDNVPYVLHFRISTQAHGRMDCTHPFPLSPKMNDLRELNCETNIGIAHNGIISLTSSYGFTKTITYSDTMEFITDYLTLIIKNKDYYKDKDKVKLIEKLCNSKLAIMDNDGHVELIGNFVESKGVIYSNESYKERKVKYTAVPTYDWWSKYVKEKTKKSSDLEDTKTADTKNYDYGYDEGYDDTKYYDEFEDHYNKEKGVYEFTSDIDCPYSWGYNYDDYCPRCSRHDECFPKNDYDYEENDSDWLGYGNNKDDDKDNKDDDDKVVYSITK